MTTLYDLYGEAIRVLQDHGWTRCLTESPMGDPNGQHCLVGALNAAVGVRRYGFLPLELPAVIRHDVLEELPASYAHRVRAIESWNDSRLNVRFVLALLRRLQRKHWIEKLAELDAQLGQSRRDYEAIQALQAAADAIVRTAGAPGLVSAVGQYGDG